MANNIYIGMRYVPLFDGPYNSEKVYEPLTVVEYNNSSYTSKKQVPAGVLPTNTEYWARSGDFNAQYNELDARITAAEDDAAQAISDAGEALTASEKIGEVPYYDITQHGAVKGGDIGTVLNSILADNDILSNYVIYAPKGSYTTNVPIVIQHDGTKLIFDGTLTGTGSSVVECRASDCEIEFYKIVGNDSNYGLLVTCPNITTGNNYFNIHFIWHTHFAIYLYAQQHGIINNVFMLNRIDHFDHAIHFYAGEIAAAYINENKFYNCWAKGSRNTETCIFMQKGANQSDWYNGNSFVNFSFEGCYYFCDLDYAERNNFDNFRFLENYHNNALVLSNTCKNNVFSSADSRRIKPEMINDAGYRNMYNMKFGSGYPTGDDVCNQATYYNGNFCALGHTLIGRNIGANSATNQVPTYYKPINVTITSNTAKAILVLPECWSHPDTAPEVLHMTLGNITNGFEIRAHDGHAIWNSDGTGASTTAAKSWSHFDLYCFGENTHSVRYIGPVTPAS